MSASYPLKLASVSTNYQALYKESISNPEGFWGDIAKKKLHWYKVFDQVMDCDMEKGEFKWFIGGELNVSVNCLDRHNSDKTALIWEKDEPGTEEKISYGELLEMTCRVANALKRDGVKKGDRVAICMPVSPLLVVSMLACARIGAIHNVVFTADEIVRGGKTKPLKKVMDKALVGCDCVKRVYVASRTGAKVDMKPDRDVSLEEAMSKEPSSCDPEHMNSEDELFILYTSGRTGDPKGIVHTQAGYILHAALTQQYAFDYHPEKDEVFACVADIGWITGHSYVVYGPLCNGGTTVLYESHPAHPDSGRYWEMVERLKVTHLYSSPTAIRMLMGKNENDKVKKYNRSSLRILGSVGEPLNKEAWSWYNDVVGEKRCTVVDTYCQTETGGIVIAPLPSPDDAPPKPGFPMRPFWGIQPELLSVNGEVQVGPAVSGHLCIKKPWPGQASTMWNDHDKFLSMYYKPHPGYYFTGDGAIRDESGDYRITGRVDDVVNIKGHKIGTAEIECAMNVDPRVAETAIIGYPHELYGEAVIAFIMLKEECAPEEFDAKIKNPLKELVRTKIASFAIPSLFLVVPDLPRSQSGKIMRSILKKIAANQSEDLGDISILANPDIVRTIKEKHDNMEQI